jgi:hypothetical protein
MPSILTSDDEKEKRPLQSWDTTSDKEKKRNVLNSLKIGG